MAFASAAAVEISPSNPDTGDNLVADVSGSATYDYYWYRDGDYHSKDMNTQESTLSASNTDAGQTWTVKAYVPATSFTDAYLLDTDSVTIQGGDEPTEEPDATVYITPSNPYDADDLTCDVSDSDATYDFYWYEGSNFVESDMNVKTATLKASNTDAGQTYTCKVYVPATSFTDAFYLGKDSVTVQEDEDAGDNNAPRATGAHITVGPGTLVDIDVEVVNSYVEFKTKSMLNALYESDTVYVYDADGDDLTYDFSSPLDNDGEWQTYLFTQGEYTSTFTVTDEHGATGDSEIEITVELEIAHLERNPPQLDPIDDIEVQEGELVFVIAHATDADGDDLTFTWDLDGIEGAETSDEVDNNNTWLDGVEVMPYTPDFLAEESKWDDVIVMENPLFEDNNRWDDVELALNPEFATEDNEVELTLNPYLPDFVTNGDTSEGYSYLTWLTDVNDAGLYTVTVTVSDGLLRDSETFTIKVNDECEDEDENGVCDEDEIVPSNYEGDKLYVKEVNVMNAARLASAYEFPEDYTVAVSGDYELEGNVLTSENTDNEVYVSMTLHNKNSFDARDLQVTFILAGERYYASFMDLDRGNKGTQLFKVDIPTNLESGKYALQVIIENDDLYNEEFINLEIDSLGDVVQIEEEQSTVKSFWKALLALFS